MRPTRQMNSHPRDVSTIRTPPLLVTATAALLTVAAPAWAGSSDTVASVTVEGGVLSVTAPADAGTLGASVGSDGATISGRLGQVHVEDSRNAADGASWVASVTTTDFAASSGPGLPAAGVGYVVGDVATTGTATLTAHDPDDLSGTVAVLTATEVAGDNSATWDPTITVAVPDGATAGTYTATITHSVV